MGMVDAAVVLEELGRAVHPGPYASSAIAAVSLLVGVAPDHDLLRGLADGTTVAAVALHEPGRRAEWRDPATTATVDGETLRIDGTKAHVADASSADVLLFTATGQHGQLGVFAVERGAPGLTVTSTPTVDGTRKEAEVVFGNTPARAISTGDASEAVAETIDRMHVAAVVDGVGAASRALEIAVDYAKERQQFGVPVGTFQAVQHLCADMLRSVELARAAGYYACWAADSADSAECHRAATMALAFAADELYSVGAGAVQVHAGVGYTWEHDVQLFYKRLLTLQSTGGGTIDQLEELATIALS
jgi:acyl-CoA dehydrogenase